MTGAVDDKNADGFVVHFQSEKMRLLKGNVNEEVVVSELARKGEVLVSIAEEDGDKAVVLVADKNCEFSASGESILAKESGYPKWEIDDNDQCVVSLQPVLEISEDKMEAVMTLYPAIDLQRELLQDLLAVFDEQGVCFGINEQAIRESIEKTGDDCKQVVTFFAAQGDPVSHGFDAHIRLEVEIGSIAGEKREDGSLDFKERRMFVYVDEGQVIGTVVPATSGTSGRDILGGTVEPRPGRDVTVRVTEDALYDEERGVVSAGKGGVVSVVNDTTFKVSSKQTISGDIDYNTGNIYAKNNVEITGGVKPDFVVAVRGDLRIGGQVQSATVSSQGNLVVNGGVMGEKSQLNIRGDVELNYIERGSVVAGGDIAIKKNVYYCTIEAGGGLLGSDSSKIVGGRVVSGGNLQIGSIGSESADSAFVAAGVDGKRLKVYEKLHRRVLEIEEKITAWLQRHGTKAEKSKKIVKLENEMAEIQVELKKLNLIKGSPEGSLGKVGFIDCHAEIMVYGVIFAGTELRIGNMTMTIEKNLINQRFHIDNLFKTIVADSL